MKLCPYGPYLVLKQLWSPVICHIFFYKLVKLIDVGSIITNIEIIYKPTQLLNVQSVNPKDIYINKYVFFFKKKNKFTIKYNLKKKIPPP